MYIMCACTGPDPDRFVPMQLHRSTKILHRSSSVKKSIVRLCDYEPWNVVPCCLRCVERVDSYARVYRWLSDIDHTNIGYKVLA